jgi:hypothetical protein
VKKRKGTSVHSDSDAPNQIVTHLIMPPAATPGAEPVGALVLRLLPVVGVDVMAWGRPDQMRLASTRLARSERFLADNQAEIRQVIGAA